LKKRMLAASSFSARSPWIMKGIIGCRKFRGQNTLEKVAELWALQGRTKSSLDKRHKKPPAAEGVDPCRRIRTTLRFFDFTHRGKNGKRTQYGQ
jgi:hypothetical protein